MHHEGSPAAPGKVIDITTKAMQRGTPADRTMPFIRKQMRGSFEHKPNSELVRRNYAMASRMDVLDNLIADVMAELRAVRVQRNNGWAA